MNKAEPSNLRPWQCWTSCIWWWELIRAELELECCRQNVRELIGSRENLEMALKDSSVNGLGAGGTQEVKNIDSS